MDFWKNNERLKSINHFRKNSMSSYKYSNSNVNISLGFYAWELAK